MTRLFWFGLLLVFFSCIEGDGVAEPDTQFQDTYIPIYGDPAEAYDISVSPAKGISNPGKIFVYKNFLMVNIPGEGFHVIDNSAPSQPQQLYFINVPGNQDVAIKDDVLYADNYGDIVAFTIDENQELQILKRLEGVMKNQLYPPFFDVYFECVDPEKGVVIDWVKVDVPNPGCYR